MSLEALVRDLQAMGVACTVMESGADGALLVTPECGRVLGLWPHWRGENALWVEPGFPGSLAAGSKDDSWTCPGGDRMWLAPAAEFLGEGRLPPPAIDPGSWDVLAEKGGFMMENRGNALAWKAGVRVAFRIRRRVRPLTEAEMERRWGATWLRRAGYEEESTLALPGSFLPGAALWNTVRVRPGGEARIGMDPAGARCRITHLEDMGAGRAILLVRDAGAGRPDARARGELSCFSTAAAAGQAARPAADRVSWNLALCAFSGRTAEVRGLAERLADLS